MTAALPEGALRAPHFLPVDIGHDIYAALTDPDTAFWALVDKSRVGEGLDPATLAAYQQKADGFRQEVARPALRPEAVRRLSQPDRALQS